MASIKWRLAQFLEIRWWRNYLKEKDVEDYLQWKQTYWKNFLDKIHLESITENSIILDAGCGPAGIFTILDKYDVTAVDPLLSEYRNKLNVFDEARFPKVNFQQIAMEDLDFVNQFDLIFCLNAINHVNDLEKSLSNLKIALKREGRLVISTDVHRSVFLKRMFKFIPGDVLHPHQLDIEEFENKLIGRGFEIRKHFEIKNGNIFNYDVWIAA